MMTSVLEVIFIITINKVRQAAHRKSLGCWWDLRAEEGFHEMNKGWGPEWDSSFRLGDQHFI